MNLSEEKITHEREKFKYTKAEPRDKAWGMTITTTGHQFVPAGTVYPLSKHPDGYNFPTGGKRTLNEHQIIYITRGEGYFESASCQRTRIEAGTMFMLFPGEWHSYAPDPQHGWDEHWVGFNGTDIEHIIESKFFTPSNCIFRIGIDNKILDIFNELYERTTEKQPGYQQYCGSLIHVLLGRVYYENINHTLNDSYITRIISQAKAIIKTDYGFETMEDLAYKLNINYSQFRREFKRVCGISPGQYRQEIKLERAKELLRTTNLSMAEISSELRFECMGQFSTFFRKRTGIPPFEYRKRCNYDAEFNNKQQ